MPVTWKKADTDHLQIHDFAAVLIPSTAEDIISQDCYLETIHLVNPTSTDQTVTIKDKQSTPREIVPTITVDAYSDQIRVLPSRYCKGGINWISSGGTVVAYMTARY